MKTLDVLNIGTAEIAAGTLSRLMDSRGIAPVSVDAVNWPDEYPYVPQVSLRIARAADKLLLDWRVAEATVRALADEDNGKVWEDSCVEFFFRVPGSHDYYNIECNCIGTLLIGTGLDRHARTHLPADALARVGRDASLGSMPFAERPAPPEWRLSLIIPVDILGIDTLDGLIMHANFYKCGDMLSRPHFLSWNPVAAPAPDFHRPDSFGLLRFLP